ncbi:MAG TPA: hypothetical protein VMT03_24540 [Polyangia bacterium]|nr:hypothetical protein [Polyangia bacterium]
MLATDAAGNQVLAGSFRGEVTVAGGRLTSVGGTDIFVVKTGPSGAPLFPPQRFGGPGDDAATGAAIDPDGSVVISGTFQGKVTFGQKVLEAQGRHSGQRDVFVARLDASGNVTLAQRLATSNVATQVSVAVQPDHSILVGVSATGTVASQDRALRLSGESVMLDHISALGEKLPPPPGTTFRIESLTLGCTHSPCKTGGPLASGCGMYGCVADVCAMDSFCCSTSWIQRCVNEMINCSRRCDCSQVHTTGYPFYPDASNCTIAIYNEDTYCSDTWWDNLCVAETFLPNNQTACNPMCQ